MKKFLYILVFLQTYVLCAQTKLKVGVDGLTHDHVGQILSSNKRGDIEIVGIAEPNKDLAMRYLKRYNLSESLLFSSLGGLLVSDIKGVLIWSSLVNSV
jgi:predicted dehydrogenase